MSIDTWMDKKHVIHIYSGILSSHKMEWIWVSSSEVDEPRVCYTEWSQKEKNKYHTLTHVLIHMESRKIVLMKLFTGKKCRCRPRPRLVDTVGVRRGWDELRKLHWHIHTIMCKICNLVESCYITQGAWPDTVMI